MPPPNPRWSSKCQCPSLQVHRAMAGGPQAESQEEKQEGRKMEIGAQAASKANLSIPWKVAGQGKERVICPVGSCVQYLLHYSPQTRGQENAWVLTKLTLWCRKTASVQIRKVEHIHVKRVRALQRIQIGWRDRSGIPDLNGTLQSPGVSLKIQMTQGITRSFKPESMVGGIWALVFFFKILF